MDPTFRGPNTEDARTACADVLLFLQLCVSLEAPYLAERAQMALITHTGILTGP